MEEQVITLLEFKTVMEEVNSNFKKIMEVMQYRFDKVDGRLDKVEGDIHSLKEQVALLHEGQTEIKHELKKKANQEDLERLEKRVVRLENKAA